MISGLIFTHPPEDSTKTKKISNAEPAAPCPLPACLPACTPPQLERDALVQGFSMLIEDLKAADDLQNFRDTEVGPTRNI